MDAVTLPSEDETTEAGPLVWPDDEPRADAGLVQLLRAAVQEHRDSNTVRQPIVAQLRQYMNQGRDTIRYRFEAGESDGAVCVRANSDLMDRLIMSLAEVTTADVFGNAGPTTAERFDLVATGGYGRRELAPFSDLDLLFLLPYKRTGRVEQIVEFILYTLWDLGLKVGHAVRSPGECMRQAKADSTIRTTLLESRHLWGERHLFRQFWRRYQKEIIAGNGAAFVATKLAERDERHRRLGDSRYLLEPNMKESKGGLRDLHTLFWIGRFLYDVDEFADLATKNVLVPEEVEHFLRDRTFLWSVRCHLHYFTGRAEDRLTFDVQPELAKRMGYTDAAGGVAVERFMKHYFRVAKDVGDLTRILCAALEAESKRGPRFNLRQLGLRKKRELDGFRLDRERLTLRHPNQFKERPIDMIRLFHSSQRHGLDIHPKALKAVTRSLSAAARLRLHPEANRLFLDILTGGYDPEATLRRMNEAGVLGRFIPDFHRVVAQMQFDMYHAYTVDEHTLFALGILHRIETGALAQDLPLATRLVRQVASRRALFVALFLHDIAKGRGGNHSKLGEQVAYRLCPRLGLTPEETDTVAWLVLNHLAMSQTAFRRDLDDDDTVQDFVELVQSPERLRLLLVLTTVDIRAVGPGRWNNWRAALLGELYYRSLDLLTGGLAAEGRDQRILAAQTDLRRRLADWSDSDWDWFQSLSYPAYWLSFDPDTQAGHARLIAEAEREGKPLTVQTRIDPERTVTEVTVYTSDRAGLFAKLTGALALGGANIVEARIFTMRNGKALDIFAVQDAHAGGPLEAPEKLEKLPGLVAETLAGRTDPAAELARRKPLQSSRVRPFQVSPRVLVDNSVSTTHTVIEVNGRDRPGFLHDIASTLTKLNLQISSAKIATYGHKVVDVFYVKDIFGFKVTHDSKLKDIRNGIMGVLQADGAAGGTPGGTSGPIVVPSSGKPAFAVVEEKQASRRYRGLRS